jgi:hypothetical protein
MNDYNRAVDKLAAALEMLEEAEAVGIDFAVVEAELWVEEAEFEFDRLCEPDPAFVW